MSLLDHPDDIEAPNIQVWNNAAFDNGESEVRTFSWSNVQDSYKNPSSNSLQSDCSKENLCPLNLKTPASVKYSVSAKPLNRNGVIGNSNGKPLRTPCVVSAKMCGVKGREEEEVISKERNIDAEIEETEREINRLATRLKSLQIEKAEQSAARTTVPKGGRFVPMKSVEPKVSIKSSNGVKMFENAMIEPKIGNRGLSLGPSEIHAGVGSRRQGKIELTPIQRMQSRRQSCLPKLLDIDEEKGKNRRGNSMSLSPKSRRTMIKAQTLRQPATTIVSKRPTKKDGVVELIQPKKLFKDIEKSAPPTSTKKPFRSGRIVASRYNQTNESFSQVTTENRKRSLPGNYKDDGSSRYDKRRSSSELCRSKAPESRVKKRWEIPSEIVVFQQEMEESCCDSPVSKVGDMLPRINTTRFVNMSPRDSGPAKRVAELIDCKTNFFADEEMEASICQKLSFAEDEEEE